MSFTEEWFGPESQRVLSELAARTNHLKGRVVEVGCWEGRSTVALANTVHPSYVHAVDTWKGSPGEISAELAQQRDVYATFKANIDELTQGNVLPFKMGWRDYFTRKRDAVRFLHIDAEHSYTEVFDTIDSALPLMVPGGIICGDDAHHQPVLSAAADRLGQVIIYSTLWYREITSGDT